MFILMKVSIVIIILAGVWTPMCAIFSRIDEYPKIGSFLLLLMLYCMYVTSGFFFSIIDNIEGMFRVWGI